MSGCKLPDSFFRELDSKEEKDFRKWAHENYDPNKKPDNCWHPVVREEWYKIALMNDALDAEDEFTLDELEEHARRRNEKST